MIRLKNLPQGGNVDIFAKLEGQNPGGSVKDRAALYMIEQAEKRGELTRGKIILEATSGNMGISLAMVGAHKGYRVRIVMSSAVSLERRQILKALGAELVLTGSESGTEGAIQSALNMADSFPHLYWFADQFNNPDNRESHYHGIGAEILREVPDIDYLTAGVGTCGTLAGIAKRVREASPMTKVAGVLPPAGYKIQGLQNPYGDFSGGLYDESLIDECYEISEKEAYRMAGKAARDEGILVGMSSGAALAAACRIADRIRKGRVVVIIPDRGEKYLSTGLFRR